MRISLSRMLGAAAAAVCLLPLTPANAQMKVNGVGNGNGGGIVLYPLSYHVYDLGTFGGYTSNAYAINNSGQVVGCSSLYTSNWFGWINHAFRHNGTAPLNQATDDLSTFGGYSSCAYAINSKGTVVGTADDLNGNSEAFHHSGPGALNPTNVTRYSNNVYDDFGDLGEGAGIPNDGWAIATGINDNDDFVGYSPALVSYPTAFSHPSGTGALFNRLLFMICPIQGTSYAYGINNSNVVVGTTLGDLPSTTYHAMALTNNLWNQFNDMGTLGGSNSSALAVNNGNTVCGWSEIVQNVGIRHAFRHIAAAGADFSLGTLSGNDDLGTLGGWNSEAHAINKYNTVVGKSDIPGGSVSHVFVYDGSMWDLNNYLDASGAGWVLTEANGINDYGTIVGQGIINGQYHAFVAVPNPRYPILNIP